MFRRGLAKELDMFGILGTHWFQKNSEIFSGVRLALNGVLQDALKVNYKDLSDFNTTREVTNSS